MPPNDQIELPMPLVAFPSIIMLLVSSRFVIFWILNIVLIFVVLRLARISLYSQTDDDVSSMASYPAGHGHNNNNYPRLPKQDATQMQEIQPHDPNESYVETIVLANNFKKTTDNQVRNGIYIVNINSFSAFTKLSVGFPL